MKLYEDLQGEPHRVWNSETVFQKVIGISGVSGGKESRAFFGSTVHLRSGSRTVSFMLDSLGVGGRRRYISEEGSFMYDLC